MSNILPAPAWFPSEEILQTANVAKLIHKLGYQDYEQFHAYSVNHYVDFWKLIIDELSIQLDVPYKNLVDISQGVEKPKWLPDAKLNIIKSCFNADPSNIALIYQSENSRLEKMSYKTLDEFSNRVANSLVNKVKKGDRVGLMMPMTPEAIAIFLGIIKAGCCVVPVAESFSTNEIAARFEIADVKLIIAQDTMLRDGKILPLYEKLLPIANLSPVVILNFQTTQEVSQDWIPRIKRGTSKIRKQDIFWSDFLVDNSCFDSVSCNPFDFTTILFSSGTTAKPKAIPWTHTTPIKCASDAFFHQDVQEGDIFCWPTSLGWMMGPWLVYATLINRATIALYDGIPIGKKFGEFVQNAKVTQLGVVPTIVKNWRSLQCMEGLNWNHIKLFSSTGECSSIQDMLYLMALAGNKPIIEYCGGTEIGGSYITSVLIKPSVPAAFNAKAMGSDFLILDENGNETDKGEVALIPPAIGLSNQLLNADHHAIYYDHMPKSSKNQILRRHGDAIEYLKNGFYRLQGRVDDTMNLAGIKVSSVEIERVAMQLEEVKEAAAIGIEPEGGGPTQLVIYVVPRCHPQGSTRGLLQTKIQEAIKTQLNPLFKLHKIVIVKELPKTASNKIMRKVLKSRNTSNG